MQALTPAAQVALLIALGLAEYLPDIAHAAAGRGEAAVMRGDDDEAVRQFALSEAADDAMILALTAIEAEGRSPIRAVQVAVSVGCDRAFVQ
jgi:hypothetical protein